VELLLERALHYAGVQDRFINDLLDASRMDVHKLELLLSLYDLKAIVQETIKDFHCTIPSRTIFFECPEHDQILVMADADRISQVITNYITNAFKYSAASEPVIVRLTRERTEAKVCVRDFGPGLTVEEQEKIWCRFYQVPSIRVQSSHGASLGLGLYICQMLIQRHNGKVGVESLSGQGSTFWFTLPLVK
jgi:signal transduction histidine kinase